MTLSVLLAMGPGVQAQSVIGRGPQDKPWVALTFDDGWSLGRCAQIVRTLRAKRAPATFFINGAIIHRAPATWRALLSGFSIANHTRTHHDLARLDASRIRWEIASNEALVERVLRRPMLRLLRPPYGSYDSLALQVAGSLGYRTILWTLDSYDTRSWATTSSVIDHGSRGGNGAVILMHCGPGVTPAAVGPIIDRYRARGYRLVGLETMFPSAVPRPPTACLVRNLDTDVVKRDLQDAVDAARAGQRLTVRGTCKGSTAIRKDLHLRGVQTETSGTPTLAGAGPGTVVTVASGAEVTIRSLTIRDGAAEDLGGGVLNRGSLTLLDVVVHDNAAARGGGIANDAGTLTIDGTTSIRANTAGDVGGGLYNRLGTVTMAVTSSVTGNTASVSGGGVYNDGGTLVGFICAPEAGANVRDNTPVDCSAP